MQDTTVLDPVTSEQIFEALMRNDSFATQPEAMRNVHRELVQGLPEALSEVLQEKVSLRMILKTKLLFYRYVLDNDYVRKLVESYEAEDLGIMSPDSAVQVLSHTLEMRSQEISRLLKEDSLSERIGIPDDQYLRSRHFGLRPEVIEALDGDGLTISQLLVMQPAMIIEDKD